MKFIVLFEPECPKITGKLNFIIPGDHLIASLLQHLAKNENLSETDRKFYMQKVKEIKCLLNNH